MPKAIGIRHGSIGVILGGAGGSDLHFLEWEDGPPFICTPSQKFCLVSVTFQTKVTPLRGRVYSVYQVANNNNNNNNSFGAAFFNAILLHDCLPAADRTD